MVSYYNTLAMFPNHHPHHHPHRASHQAHPGAAAAAAYFGYAAAGYAAPQHQHFNMSTPPHHPHYAHHPHHQFSAAVAAAAAQAASGASPGPTSLGDLAACNGGGGNSSSLGLTPSPGLDNPCSSPPNGTLQSLHQHGGFSQQQQQFESGGLGGLGASPPAPNPGWHNATPPPLYGSSCARHYEDWPSTAASQPPPPPLVGPAHSPGSPTGGYKFSSTLEFQQSSSHQCPPPPPPPLQQPQDLSQQLGGGPGAGGGQHPSPDSGLAGSSDGVSSSAGSPQLQLPPAHQLGGGHHAAANVRPPNPRSPYEWMKKPSYHSQPNPVGSLLENGLSLQDLPGKTRTKDKYRVVYSDHQRLELEKEFHYSRYITIRRKSELAATLGLSERQVKIWFQNRRAKERKQVKKREEMIHKEKMEVAVQMQQHQQQLAGGAVVM